MSTDYSNHAFRKDTKLEVTPMFLESVYKYLERVLSEDGVGTYTLTEPRFEYVDPETSKVVKKVTKANQDKVRKIFSLEKTMAVEPTQHLTKIGIQTLALLEAVNMVRLENMESGKGVPVEELMAEMEVKE